MLGKLLKYEFKSTSRVMLPLYLMLMGLAVVNGFYFKNLVAKSANMNFSDNLIGSILVFAFFAIIVAILVITIYYVVTRFYKNLLGEEGYLMFTLPVKTSSLVKSKMMFAVIWTMVSYFIIILCMVIIGLIMSNFSFSEIVDNIGKVIYEFQLNSEINIYLAGIMIFLVYIVSTLLGLLNIYLAMAIGHLRNKGRIMTSIGAYIGIIIIIQIITSISFNLIDKYNLYKLFENMTPNLAFVSVTGLITLFISVVSFMLYKLVCIILAKRLNLE
ncbi:MAG: hypothetical protein ACRDA4_02955 [Filifactoraceae bacterium]